MKDDKKKKKMNKEINSRFRQIRVHISVYQELKKLAKGSSFGKYIASLIGVTYEGNGQ